MVLANGMGLDLIEETQKATFDLHTDAKQLNAYFEAIGLADAWKAYADALLAKDKTIKDHLAVFHLADDLSPFDRSMGKYPYALLRYKPVRVVAIKQVKSAGDIFKTRETYLVPLIPTPCGQGFMWGRPSNSFNPETSFRSNTLSNQYGLKEQELPQKDNIAFKFVCFEGSGTISYECYMGKNYRKALERPTLFSYQFDELKNPAP